MFPTGPPPSPTIIPHSQPCLTEADRTALDTVVRSGMIAEGKRVLEFEAAVSQYLGLTGGVAASTGTSALFLALQALQVKAGDEVIIPTYVCRSVADAVVAAGATPVLCDIGDDWCMNADTLKPHLSPRTKAIVLVHIFGIAADPGGILELGIPVIEDCCQALGAWYAGAMAGSFGQLCVLSFHATKLLTTGEGGMVLTGDRGLLEKLHTLKHGTPNLAVGRHRHPLTDIQASLGLSQLKQYPSFLERRRAIADYYFSQLEGLPVQLPDVVRGRSIFFRFPLRIRGDFATLQKLFAEHGIQVRRGVDSLLHRQMGLNPAMFAMAEQRWVETLSIPIYPSLSYDDCQRVAIACRRLFLNNQRKFA